MRFDQALTVKQLRDFLADKNPETKVIIGYEEYGVALKKADCIPADPTGEFNSDGVPTPEVIFLSIDSKDKI